MQPPKFTRTYPLSREVMDETLQRCGRSLQEFGKARDAFFDAHGRRGTVFKTDVTHMLDAFPHLGIIPGYRLAAYIHYEYHGPTGYIAAIESEGDIPDAVLDAPSLAHVVLPECAMDPAEVLYCNGCANGYFEAVLFADLRREIPLGRNIYCPMVDYLFARPDLPEDKWDIWLDPKDWTPKAEISCDGCRMLLFTYHHEHGMEASDGLNHIHLEEVWFDEPLIHYVLDRAKRSRFPKTKDLHSLIPKGKKPCLLRRTSIQLAKQRPTQV